MRELILKSNESQALWKEIVSDFRQACGLRREGKQVEATRLIDEELPRVIARWSQADRRSGSVKQAALRALFATEQSQQPLSTPPIPEQDLASILAGTLLPPLRQHVSEQLREGLAQEFRTWQNRALLSPRVLEADVPRAGRVRFDDIPAVIDALLAEQKADCAPRQAFAY